MKKCLKFELIKFFNIKILFIFLLFQVIWTIIVALSISYSTHDSIVNNFILIRTLTINGNFYIPIIVSLVIGRIFSIEYENNIEFALKLYKNDHIERYIYKTLICIIYIVVSYGIQFLIALIIQTNIQVDSMDLSFWVIDTEVVFEQRCAFYNILTLYLNQILGSIFILEMFIFYINFNKNYLKSALLTIISIFTINAIEYFMFLFSKISNNFYKYLPFNSEYTWRSLKFLQFGDLATGLVFFSIFLSMINIITFKHDLKGEFLL